MSRPTLDVIIVNWNAGRWLIDCLRALDAARPTACALRRVVVVDNASSDGSCDALAESQVARAWTMPLTLVRNRTNRGFAAACNQGARASTADYLLFLNPDSLATADALDAVVSMLETHAARSVDIAGVWMEGQEGAQTLWLGAFPTARTFIFQALGLRERWRRDVRLDATPPAAEDALGAMEVNIVGGAFFTIRRTLFERLRGFDERFFMYYDELDLCLRARRLGARAMVARKVTVYHHNGACSDRVPAMRLFYLLRSRLRYARAHFTRPQVAVLATLMCSYEPILRLGRAVLGRGPERVGEVAEACARFAASLAGINPEAADDGDGARVAVGAGERENAGASAGPGAAAADAAADERASESEGRGRR